MLQSIASTSSAIPVQPVILRNTKWCSTHGVAAMLVLHAAPGAQAVGQSFAGRQTDQPDFYKQSNYGVFHLSMVPLAKTDYLLSRARIVRRHDSWLSYERN